MKPVAALGVVFALCFASSVAAWPTKAVVTEPLTATKTTVSARKQAATTTALPSVTPATRRVTPLAARTKSNGDGTMSPCAVGPGDGTSIEGTYSVAGKADGTAYVGSMTLARSGGAIFRAIWHVGGNTFYGNCLRDDDLLSCGWAVKANDANVVAYVVAPTKLDGAWFGAGEVKLGSETLVAKTASKMPSGTFDIAPGRNPDGTTYTGSAVITALPAIASVYQVDWTFGTAVVKGLGIRSSSACIDHLFSVGFADGNGGDYGTLQYRVESGGQKLTGLWVQSVGGQISGGDETASKKP